MDHPGDVAAIGRLFDRGIVDPASVVAILGKTEGNGCVNDFTRAFAVTVLKAMLAEHLGCTPAEAGDRVSLMMCGGTEGGDIAPFPRLLGERSIAPARRNAVAGDRRSLHPRNPAGRNR
jgi:cyanuric acid amidohydrolase